jgi:hypothetical protein
VAKKKSGYGKKSKNWLGRTIIEHYNEKGKKTGFSKRTKDFWGNSITERFSNKGEKKGFNKSSKTFWGGDVTERFDSKGERIGYNKKSHTFWGTPVTDRYNTEGEKTGHSIKTSTFWGTPITQHYDDRPTSSRVSTHAQGGSAAYGPASETSSPGSSGSSWLWFVGIIILIGIILRSGVLESLIVNHPSPPVPSHASTPDLSVAPPLSKPYEPVRYVGGRDSETGLITIEATVDLVGTTRSGWFTIITGGMKQQTFLIKENPLVGVGDRLRITYDEHVPAEQQESPFFKGVIVAMNVVRLADSPSGVDGAASSEVQIENDRLIPVDDGAEDWGFSTFRNELIGAIARKDRSYLLGVVAPDIKVGFGSEPDNAEEFARIWKIQSPDSELWAKLDRVLRLGSRFEVANGERKYCAPYLCGTWPADFDPLSYVAVTGQAVPMRTLADDNSATVANLSYNVVRLVEWTPDRRWAHVTMADGTSGFVDGGRVRSPIDYRAVFRQVNGKWMMSSFLAGD